MEVTERHFLVTSRLGAPLYELRRTTSTITPGFRDRSSGSLWWKAQNIGIYFIEGIQATLTRYTVLAYPWEGRCLCHTYHSYRRGAHRSQNLAERAAAQYDPQSPLVGWPAQTRPEPVAAPSLHVPGNAFSSFKSLGECSMTTSKVLSQSLIKSASPCSAGSALQPSLQRCSAAVKPAELFGVLSISTCENS